MRRESAGRIRQAILYALLAPVGFLALLKHRGSEWLRWRRMKHRGRAIAFPADSGGTFILDYPSRAWGWTDLWWTPDRVETECPVRPVRRNTQDLLGFDLGFDRWCRDRYLDEPCGRAKLVRARSGFQELVERYQDLAALSVVEISSALVAAQDRAATKGVAGDHPADPERASTSTPTASSSGLRMLTEHAKRRCGERTRGAMAFFLTPQLLDVGPFNLQRLRVDMFRELVAAVPFDACVETGSARGSTTGFLHRETRRPVYSVECAPRIFGYVSTRFLWNRSIVTLMGDSREALGRLLPGLEGQTVFFYLDAHGGSDLPLLQETLLIFRSGVKTVVMIDDFEVPGDEGYGYDDYGEGASLTLDYLAPLAGLGVVPYLPAAPSTLETGGSPWLCDAGATPAPGRHVARPRIAPSGRIPPEVSEARPRRAPPFVAPAGPRHVKRPRSAGALRGGRRRATMP